MTADGRGAGVDDPRRRVPRTDVALADPALVDAAGRLGADLVKAAVVAAQRLARSGALPPEQVVAHAVASLPARATTLRAVLARIASSPQPVQAAAP